MIHGLSFTFPSLRDSQVGSLTECSVLEGTHALNCQWNKTVSRGGGNSKKESHVKYHMLKKESVFLVPTPSRLSTPPEGSWLRGERTGRRRGKLLIQCWDDRRHECYDLWERSVLLLGGHNIIFIRRNVLLVKIFKSVKGIIEKPTIIRLSLPRLIIVRWLFSSFHSRTLLIFSWVDNTFRSFININRILYVKYEIICQWNKYK
jgi:hypothetical protein